MNIFNSRLLDAASFILVIFFKMFIEIFLPSRQTASCGNKGKLHTVLFEERLPGIGDLIFGEKYFFFTWRCHKKIIIKYVMNKNHLSSPGVVRVESGGDLGIEHQALHQLFITCIQIHVK